SLRRAGAVSRVPCPPRCADLDLQPRACALCAPGFMEDEQMANKAVSTEKAPKAIGPYSQAIVAGDLVFTSGQVPLDPQTQQMVQGDVRAQTERVMEHLGAVLESAGACFAQVGKSTIF